MTREEAVKKIIDHNNTVDNYISNELPRVLGLTGDKITINEWFVAQNYISQQHFYSKAMAILKECRANGYDVKINMQSDKLIGLGVGY